MLRFTPRAGGAASGYDDHTGGRMRKHQMSDQKFRNETRKRERQQRKAARRAAARLDAPHRAQT